MQEFFKHIALWRGVTCVAISMTGCGDVNDIVERELEEAGVSGTCYGPCQSLGKKWPDGDARPACISSQEGTCLDDGSNCGAKPSTNAECGCHDSEVGLKAVCLCATGKKNVRAWN